MEGHLTGAFPRSEALVEASRAAARGRVSPDELEAAYARDMAALTNLQTQAKVEFVVDGQLNWKDLFRPFSELLTGIRLGGLTRWFDNNTFYRKPIIVDKVRYAGTSLDRYFRCSLPHNGARWKAVFPGPYTFAVMSQNNAYSSFGDLIDALAHSLKDVISELKKEGYEYFQFNEPCVCFSEPSKNELQLIKQAYEVLVKGIGAKTALHTYFGDAGKVIDSILDCATDCVGIDFYATSIASLVEHDFTKEIGCGCIDARNSLLETPDALRKLIRKVEDDVAPKAVYVTPNCDLEFLPQSIAVKKLHILAEAKETVA